MTLEVTRDAVVAEARRYLKPRAKWRNRGRDARGLDCIGLPIVVARALNVPHEDFDSYSRFPDGDKLITTLRKYMDVVQPPLKKGMLAVFHDSARPCHVGFISEKHDIPYLIHCSATLRGMHEEPFDQRWWGQLRMLLDFPGIID